MQFPSLLAISAKSLPSEYGHGDWHWRIARPFARLQKSGVDAATCWLDADDRPTISPSGRLVILQRVMKAGSESEVSQWVQSLRDAGALAVVFEIDDDEISPAVLDWMDAAGGLERVGRARLERERQGLLWTMQACDAVTVSTEALAEVVRRYTDRPVIVVPNAIDVAWFRSRLSNDRPWSDHLTIGWAGGRRPEADLAPMAVAWARIARRYPEVRFVVAGWQSDVIYRELDAVDALDRIIRVPWLALDETAKAYDPDLGCYPRAYQVAIGCCPLADTAFNRCKSPIKAYEYALAGASIVASPTVYRACVGLYGQIAETADAWESALSTLIEHTPRRRWGSSGTREHVERHHSLLSSLRRWADAYSQVASVAAGVGV